MLIQILDVDYVMLNGNPVVRIFGKGVDGKTVCGFYEGCLPYFYVTGKNAEDLLKKEDLVFEKLKKNIVPMHEPQTVYKVILKDPSKTPEVKEKLKSLGLKPYEADILFKYRFMVDFGLKGMGWVDIKGQNIDTKSIFTDKAIQIKEMKPVDRTENVDMKILVFDLECVSQKSDVPDPKRDPVIIISLVFSCPYKGKKSMVLSTRPGNGVVYLEDEKSMLEEFIKIVNDYDCDILSAYNINNFDLPYILERMRQNGIRPLFGRCGQKVVFSKKIGIRNKSYIIGRVVVDSYELVKKDFSLARYDLGFVSKVLLEEEKVDVKLSEIERLWRGSDKEFQKLVEYALKDSVLAMKLVQKLNLIDKYIALSRVSGTLLQDTLGGGETLRIENFLLGEFNRNNYIFPCKPEQSEAGRRENKKAKELRGGYVIEPERGLHSNVVVLDFMSMYPSIIQTYNICPSTLVRSNGDNVIKTPSGAMFYKKEIKEGIIPRVVGKLIRERRIVKKKLKTCKDAGKARVLDAEQWALKIMANAFYGYFGYPRARMFYLDIANAVTSCGRNLIKRTVEKVKEKYGYKIIYGDTDSLLVNIDKGSLDEIGKEANRIVDDINKELPGSIELEFEKLFKRFLPLTKKRYVAWCFERTEEGWKESIEMKGIETVRRDWCELTSETMKGVVEIILKRNDVKEAVNYFKGVVERLLRGEIPIQKLAITKSITKSPERYAGMQPHIELVKKLQKRSPGEAPGIGDRVPYVIVKGLGLLSKRAEDPMYVIEHGLQVDSKYYIENQLLPPLQRIFSGLGISKSELLGNGKQIGILDAIKNHANNMKVGKVKIGLEDVNGFVCVKCNGFYRRIPLVGVCECGGEFVFSSPKGSAKEVLV